MKKVFEAIIILLIVSSCETDFNIEASEKEIPVVYGVLNVSEPKQYIRVQRAFLSKGGNVADLSKDPDILYYSEGRAILTVTGTGRTILGKRINTEDIGIKRDSGFLLNHQTYCMNLKPKNGCLHLLRKLILLLKMNPYLKGFQPKFH